MQKNMKFNADKANELDELLLELYPDHSDDSKKTNDPDNLIDEHIFSLSMLDGYLTAVLLCPEPIAPQDWIEGIWREDGLPDFIDDREQDYFVQSVTAYYEKLRKCFNNELSDFEPLVYHIMNNDRPLPAIDLWLDGFERGFEYFEPSWKLNAQIEDTIDTILDLDEETSFDSLSLEPRNKTISKLADLIIQLYALNRSNPNN